MRSMTMIRAALLAAFSLAASMAGALAQSDPAAGYPNKPIHFVLGFAAGGGTDLLARIVGPKLSDILGQPVIVENRTGAGGRLAVEYVQSQPADGHTVLIGAIGQLAVATAIYPGKLSFHPTRTLMPVTMLGSYPLVLSGPASGEIKTVADLVAFGKANPDKSNYPTSSPAFTIASELFKLKTGMPGQPIPYRSTNEMVLSVVGGQTLFAFPDSGIVVPMAQGGKVRALAVGSCEPHSGIARHADPGRGRTRRRRPQDAMDRRVSRRRLAAADRKEARDSAASGGRRRRRARAHPRHHVFPGGRHRRGIPRADRRRHPDFLRRGEGGEPEVRAVGRFPRAPFIAEGKLRPER